jgi:peptide/nickel transport system substrate-binding protein
MLGWGVSTLDSHYVFNYLVKGADKGWNGTGFDDPKINDLILKIEKEVDFPKRDKMIATIWSRLRENVNYLPLHHQVIVWAMSDKIDIPIVADDGVRFIYTKFK